MKTTFNDTVATHAVTGNRSGGGFGSTDASARASAPARGAPAFGSTPFPAFGAPAPSAVSGNPQRGSNVTFGKTAGRPFEGIAGPPASAFGGFDSTRAPALAPSGGGSFGSAPTTTAFGPPVPQFSPFGSSGPERGLDSKPLKKKTDPIDLLCGMLELAQTDPTTYHKIYSALPPSSSSGGHGGGDGDGRPLSW